MLHVIPCTLSCETEHSNKWLWSLFMQISNRKISQDANKIMARTKWQDLTRPPHHQTRGWQWAEAEDVISKIARTTELCRQRRQRKGMFLSSRFQTAHQTKYTETNLARALSCKFVTRFVFWSIHVAPARFTPQGWEPLETIQAFIALVSSNACKKRYSSGLETLHAFLLLWRSSELDFLTFCRWKRTVQNANNKVWKKTTWPAIAYPRRSIALLARGTKHITATCLTRK